MTANCRRTQALLMRMQGAFLETPGLMLTLAQAQKRFGVDAITCEAVLEALVDASVLDKTRASAYVRCFPRLVGRALAPAHGAQDRRHGRPAAAHAAA